MSDDNIFNVFEVLMQSVIKRIENVEKKVDRLTNILYIIILVIGGSQGYGIFFK